MSDSHKARYGRECKFYRNRAARLERLMARLTATPAPEETR